MMKAKVEPWFREQDGWWYVTRRVRGKRKQIRLVEGKENRDAAYQRFYEVMAADLDRESDLTFNQLAFLFLTWTKEQRSGTTATWYASFLDSFDRHYHGLVVDLHVDDVEGWLRTTSWSQSTRRQAITSIKRAINWGYERNYLDELPRGLRSLKRPAMTCREKVVSEDEHEAMMEETDEAFGTFLTALRETGARPSEVREVTAAMVDLTLGVWVFSDHKTFEKTGKKRVIYLTPRMVELTEDLIAEHPSGPLFRNTLGKPWSGNAVRCRMRRLREKLGLEKGTVAYAYRHTYTTEGLRRGIGIAEMAELLGHQDTKMISTHYAHLEQKVDHLREAARKAAGD